MVADGNTTLTRDPSGGVLTEATTKTLWRGWGTTTTTSSADVLTDVLGSTVSVATAGGISADLAVIDDFGAQLNTPKWDTISGFTGQVDTSGLLEFASRTFDPASRVWLQDDAYRGTAARASSMNRYTYVEGAPESFVDARGFHRAAAAFQAQRLIRRARNAVRRLPGRRVASIQSHAALHRAVTGASSTPRSR